MAALQAVQPPAGGHLVEQFVEQALQVEHLDAQFHGPVPISDGDRAKLADLHYGNATAAR